MKKWLFAILFGTVFVLGACGGENEADDNGAVNDSGQTDGGETVASAEDIYQANCAACHGANLAGGAGVDLTQIGAEYSSEELHDIISNGTNGGMPGFANKLSDEEIQQLSDWLAEKK